MKPRFPSRPALLLGLGLLLASRISAQEPPGDWEPGRKVDGDGFAYQVFSRQNEGEAFVRFLLRGAIDAPPPALARAFLEYVTDPTRASEGETIHVISKEERAFTVYTHMDLPPLFSDRDIIVQGESSIDAATGVNRVAWKAIATHPTAPQIDGTIRIVDAAGAWVFAPAGERRSDVTYENHLDLRGSLPRWLLQPLMGRAVAKSFEAIAADVLGRSPKSAGAK
ncbi:MAG TPA: hypothetical protein VMS55_09120 [Myxococcota bacterium]|nr:hypothetical protein [Myxococcota bacterium]